MKLKQILNIYFWYELKWKIRNYFFPRNKWLFKKIGNDYSDISGIIDVCLFECLVHFVEVEKGLDSIWSDELYSEDLDKGYISEEYKDNRSTIRNELEEAYNYIATERAILENQRDNSYPEPLKSETPWFTTVEDGRKIFRMLSCEERYGMSYEDAYSEIIRIEQELEDRDNRYMHTIVKHRQYLWT